jgi:hypothetical protein
MGLRKSVEFQSIAGSSLWKNQNRFSFIGRLNRNESPLLTQPCVALIPCDVECLWYEGSNEGRCVACYESRGSRSHVPNGLRVGRGKWNRNLCIKYFKTMPRQMLED